MTSGTKIVSDFGAALRSTPGLRVAGSPLSRNILAVSGPKTCLLYVKGRAEPPLRWGVTANVVERLRAQSTNWYTVLLFNSKDSGYLLSSSDVLYYMSNVWPLGTDGDYKPASGSYLSRNAAFGSFGEFARQLGITAA